MSTTQFISWLALASFLGVAGCTKSRSDQAQLDRLTNQISQLDQRVHNLEVSNAELQVQLRAIRPQPTADEIKSEREEFQKRLQAAQQQAGEQQPKIPAPPRSQPPTNQVPRLTPL